MRRVEVEDPQRIGNYAIRARLGQGAMGTVYLGLSPGGRSVALKVVRAELARDREFRDRFRQEIDSARAVGGFWTAAVVDADPAAEQPWLATEYVPGPTLAEAVERHGPLPEPALLRLTAGLAEALAAIHAAGLLHRDLKPSNVLLAADGPRVIDFGIAKAVHAASGVTGTGIVVGTPGFLSPEQIEAGEVGPASDVFALGSVLVHAAAGRGPFGDFGLATTLYKIVHGQPDLDGVPARLRGIASRCLDPRPEARPTPGDLLAEIGHPEHAEWLPPAVRDLVEEHRTRMLAPVPRPGTRAYTGAAPVGPAATVEPPTGNAATSVGASPEPARPGAGFGAGTPSDGFPAQGFPAPGFPVVGPGTPAGGAFRSGGLADPGPGAAGSDVAPGFRPGGSTEAASVGRPTGRGEGRPAPDEVAPLAEESRTERVEPVAAQGLVARRAESPDSTGDAGTAGRDARDSDARGMTRGADRGAPGAGAAIAEDSPTERVIPAQPANTAGTADRDQHRAAAEAGLRDSRPGSADRDGHRAAAEAGPNSRPGFAAGDEHRAAAEAGLRDSRPGSAVGDGHRAAAGAGPQDFRAGSAEVRASGDSGSGGGDVGSWPAALGARPEDSGSLPAGSRPLAAEPGSWPGAARGAEVGGPATPGSGAREVVPSGFGRGGEVAAWGGGAEAPAPYRSDAAGPPARMVFESGRLRPLVHSMGTGLASLFFLGWSGAQRHDVEQATLLFLFAAGLGLLAVGALWTALRPKSVVEVSGQGIVVLRPGRRIRVDWQQIAKVRVVSGVAGRPWLAVWPRDGVAGLGSVGSGMRLAPVGHGVGPGRRSRDVADLRAALAWYGGTTYDPQP
ncbi:serine/threonine-protein kinase [Actinokineospora spheciospongiae]|uniref:serine/threonine-protein kinase n=1 Tax=Actinokineospora spheciospongiae TaxID=909613 RepID=UPI000D89A14D|nr:serine/threonine-protein kinase [Actinokineospora spheciospongiae]PWW54871.1 serine/threonine protein kinase [Actinokineospora spheciospongiae]